MSIRQSAAICVIACCAGYLYGQSRFGLDLQSSMNAHEAIAGLGSYVLEWRRHYERHATSGFVTKGISDDNGALWLITTQSRLGIVEEFLTKINPDGQLFDSFKLQVPLTPAEWVQSWAPAVSKQNVGVLATLVSGGRDQTIEGAFYIPIGSDGPGEPVRIAGRGPQFTTMIGGGTGEFIAAGDQEPLTLVKLSPSGTILWRRVLSSKLVLPVLSVASSGRILVLSQRGSYILLQVFDSWGRTLQSKRISAKQGTVVADPDGGCSLLFHTKFAGSDDNKVYFVSLDKNLRELKRVETPLIAWGGRTYQLISTHRGHVIVGEGSTPKPAKTAPAKILAEIDNAGKILWQRSMSSTSTPLLAPFPSGFYLMREHFDSNGMDVEKYRY